MNIHDLKQLNLDIQAMDSITQIGQTGIDQKLLLDIQENIDKMITAIGRIQAANADICEKIIYICDLFKEVCIEIECDGDLGESICVDICYGTLKIDGRFLHIGDVEEMLTPIEAAKVLVEMSKNDRIASAMGWV